MATFAQIREASAEDQSQVLVGTVTATSPLTVDFGFVSESTDTVLVKAAGYVPASGDEVICQRVGNFYVVLDKLGDATSSSWTPVVGSGLTVGNGSWDTSYYVTDGARCSFFLYFVFGSTSAVTGDVRIEFPVPIAGNFREVNSFRGFFEDSSGTDYLAAGYRFSSTAFRIVAPARVAANERIGAFLINATTPFTWTTGDIITLSGSYRIA